MFALLLFVLSFSPSAKTKPEPAPHWHRANDAYFVHNMYLGGYDEYLGDYYETRKGDPFTAQCDAGTPTDFNTEVEARAFVHKCPE